MIAWGLDDLARKWRGRTVLYAAAAVPIFTLLVVVALGADHLLAEQPYPLGTLRRLPRGYERLCPEPVRPGIGRGRPG